ncbi:benzoate/H(+) symporter BenE family transporter [Bacillus sp. T3]|uniref:benzoate/H(+) symporter BenE family transporter n=1 Tax=Bacillus sp. T3 TaxID=467262 RepID=UPI0029816010|nr:benzoate/H(+) symporter BenE family transporter [Bacillus sp. T3]
MGQPERTNEPISDSLQEKNKTSFLKDFTSQNVSAGLISFTLIMTGPALIILQAAKAGQFTGEQTINWIFAVYFFGGLFGIVLPLLFRVPITGGHSISGVAFLATMTAQFTYPQLIGGYVMSGLFILLIGLTGLFTKMMKWVPIEVISAMLAGLVANYVVKIVQDVKDLPIIGAATLISFLISMKFSRRIPAVMISVVVAFITLLLTQDFTISSSGFSFAIPTLQMPEFTWMGFVTLALPLAMLILSNDVAARNWSA